MLLRNGWAAQYLVLKIVTLRVLEIAATVTKDVCLSSSVSLHDDQVLATTVRLYSSQIPLRTICVYVLPNLHWLETQFGNLHDYVFLPQFSSISHILYCLCGHCVLWCRAALLSSSVTASAVDLALVASLWLGCFSIQGFVMQNNQQLPTKTPAELKDNSNREIWMCVPPP